MYIITVLIVLLLCSSYQSIPVSDKEIDYTDSLTVDEATKIIQFYVNSHSYNPIVPSMNNNEKESLPYMDSDNGQIQDRANNVLCKEFTCCNITETESCALNKLSTEKSTLILPGGETRCILSTSTPYAFQVIPGALDKVLFYFQGGGACWTEESTKLRLCTRDAIPKAMGGVFDRDNINNKFRDYTIIQALYCSGDIWAGDVTRDYTDAAGMPVVQTGLANAQATLDWVLKQQQLGFLSSTLSELLILGCSAGSIGAQIWASTVLSTLKWSKAAVVPDSYTGVFPEGSQGPLIYDFGLCSWSNLPSSLYDDCMNQDITLQDFNSLSFKSFPSVPFAFVQSKADIVQRSFYTLIAISLGKPSRLTAQEFYDGVNEIYGVYNKENSNFISYLVNGRWHCLTPVGILYTADGLGPPDRNSTDNTEATLNEWISSFPLAQGQSAETVCVGDLESERKASDAEYCSSNVYPKVFIET